MPRQPGNPKRRRNPVHHPVHWKADRSTIVFLTVTTASRRPILARADASDAIVDAWRLARDWRVGRYVLMPDHIHLFAAPFRLDTPVVRWVKYWKTLASRRWPRPDEHPIWAADVWDTQLRDGESYDGRWSYVLENPVRAGLVTRASDWPFAGEVHVLDWREP